MTEDRPSGRTARRRRDGVGGSVQGRRRRPNPEEVVGGTQLGKHDRVIRQRGPDDAVSAVDQRGHELL